MPVSSAYTDPNSLDLTTGQVLTQTIWENLLGCVLFLFGTGGTLTNASASLGSDVTLTANTAITLITTAALTAGTYEYEGSVTVNCATANTVVSVWVQTGTSTAAVSHRQTSGVAAADMTITVTGKFAVPAGDTLILKAQSVTNASTAKRLDTTNNFGATHLDYQKIGT